MAAAAGGVTGPIVINGDADFTPANGVHGGTGTADDPYLIGGWTHYTSVEIRDTTAHFVLRGAPVGGANSYVGAVSLYNVSHARLENLTHYYGANSVLVSASTDVTVVALRSSAGPAPPVLVQYSDFVLVEDCWLGERNGTSSYYDGKAAVDALRSTNVTVRNNTIVVGKSAGVRFSAVDGGLVEGNNMSTAFGAQAIEILGGSGVVLRANKVHHQYDQYGNDIRLSSALNATVEDNMFLAGDAGVQVDHAQGTLIRNNTIANHRNFGVHIIESDGVTLLNNSFSKNGQDASGWRGAGVTLRGATNLTMRGNTFDGDGLQFDRWGSVDAYASHDITPDNLVNGDPLVYRARCTSADIAGPAGQVFAADCARVAVSNVTAGPAAVAVFMYQVSQGIIEDSEFNGTTYGIESLSGQRLEVRRTTINGSVDALISFAEQATVIEGGTISSSLRGLSTGGPGSVEVSRTTFTGNRYAVQAAGPGAFVVGNSSFTGNDVGFAASGPADGLLMDRNYFEGNRQGAFAQGSPGRPVEVTRNRFVGNAGALTVQHGPGAHVERNVFESNTESGLTLLNCSGAVVRENEVARTHGPGINVIASDGTVVEENTIVSDGISISGTLPQLLTLRIAANNTVNGLPVLFRADCQDLTVDGTALGQVILVNCTDVVLANLSIDRTDTAVMVHGGSNVTVRDSSFRDNDGSAVAMAGVTAGWVEGNMVDGTTHSGISVSGNHLVLTGNRVGNASYYGLSAYRANNTQIDRNEIVGNYNGIGCSECNGATIARNHITGSWGPTVYQPWTCGSYRLDQDSGPPVACPMVVIPPTYAGHGVDILQSSRVDVVGNEIVGNNGSGVRAVDAQFIMVYPRVYGSSVNITGNLIAENNGTGVAIAQYDDVHVHHNSFINNTMQAEESDEASVEWDDGYPSGGNYWSDHIAPDEYAGPGQDEEGGPDGILDAPYEIGIVVDRYPLAAQPSLGEPPAIQTDPPWNSTWQEPESGEPPTVYPGQPGTPPERRELAIYANASDPDGIDTVVLCYRYSPDSDYVCIPMTWLGGSEYVAWVPWPSGGHVLEYHITGRDRTGDVTRSPEVGDHEAAGPREDPADSSVTQPESSLGLWLLIVAAALGAAFTVVLVGTRRRG